MVRLTMNYQNHRNTHRVQVQMFGSLSISVERIIMGAKSRRFFLKKQTVIIVIHILRRNQLEIRLFLGDFAKRG